MDPLPFAPCHLSPPPGERSDRGGSPRRCGRTITRRRRRASLDPCRRGLAVAERVMQVIGPPPDECFVLTPRRLAPFHPLHRDGVHPYQCVLWPMPASEKGTPEYRMARPPPARGALIERPAGAASRPNGGRPRASTFGEGIQQPVTAESALALLETAVASRLRSWGSAARPAAPMVGHPSLLWPPSRLTSVVVGE